MEMLRLSHITFTNNPLGFVIIGHRSLGHITNSSPPGAQVPEQHVGLCNTTMPVCGAADKLAIMLFEPGQQFINPFYDHRPALVAASQLLAGYYYFVAILRSWTPGR